VHLSASAVQAQPRSAGAGAGAPAWGGGALADLGPALIGPVLLAARPARAVAVAARLEGSGAPAGVEDHAQVALRFDDGLVATVVASWRGTGAPRWDVQAASATGALRAELLPTPLLEHDGEPVALPPPRAATAALDAYGYLAQLAAALEDHAARRAPFCDATFGRAVLEVVVAAAASSAAGVEVPLPFTGARSRTPAELWAATPPA
jgi:predicted dehydrogenase